MSNADTCCGLVPYFKIHADKQAEFKALVPAFVEKSRTEPQCAYYAFSFDGDHAHCREGYDSASGVLAHLENVGALLGEALKIADITRLEVHAPAADLDALREPLKGLNPQFFVVEPGGFRR
jgi:hypothetical protein